MELTFNSNTAKLKVFTLQINVSNNMEKGGKKQGVKLIER